MKNGFDSAINIPVSIKIPIRVVRLAVAAKVKEEKKKLFAFWRSIKHSLAFIIGILLIIGSLPALSAFEAHVVNVTAILEAQPRESLVRNNLLLAGSFLNASSTDPNLASNISISPPAGNFCNDKSLEISLATTSPADQIIYTLDGTDPVCNSNGYIYDKTFFLTGNAVVKASTCLEEAQGVMATWNFDLSADYCDLGPVLAAENLIISSSTEEYNSSSSESSIAPSQNEDGQGDSGQIVEPAPTEETSAEPAVEAPPAVEPAPPESVTPPEQTPPAPENPPAASPILPVE
jgi:hypothetical protein